MPLTSPQRQQLHAALLAAFDEDALKSMLAFEADTDLDAIVGKGPLTQRVFNLVAWADRQGKIAVLIAGARRQNPGNPQLQAVAQAAKTWDVASPGATAAQQPAIPGAASSQPPNVAHVSGGGATAQQGSVAAGSSGMAVGGDGHGNVTIYQNSSVTAADKPSHTDVADQAAEGTAPKPRQKLPGYLATAIIVPVLVGVVLLFLEYRTGWFGAQPDAPAAPIEVTGAVEIVDVSRGQTKKVTVGGVNVLVSVPSDPSPIAPLSGTDGVPVVVVAGGAQAAGAVKLGECLLVDDVVVALVDVQNPFTWYARFAVALPPSSQPPPTCVNTQPASQ